MQCRRLGSSSRTFPAPGDPRPYLEQKLAGDYLERFKRPWKDFQNQNTPPTTVGQISTQQTLSQCTSFHVSENEFNQTAFQLTPVKMASCGGASGQ